MRVDGLARTSEVEVEHYGRRSLQSFKCPYLANLHPVFSKVYRWMSHPQPSEVDSSNR